MLKWNWFKPHELIKKFVLKLQEEYCLPLTLDHSQGSSTKISENGIMYFNRFKNKYILTWSKKVLSAIRRRPQLRHSASDLGQYTQEGDHSSGTVLQIQDRMLKEETTVVQVQDRIHAAPAKWFRSRIEYKRPNPRNYERKKKYCN